MASEEGRKEVAVPGSGVVVPGTEIVVPGSEMADLGSEVAVSGVRGSGSGFRGSSSGVWKQRFWSRGQGREKVRRHCPLCFTVQLEDLKGFLLGNPLFQR